MRPDIQRLLDDPNKERRPWLWIGSLALAVGISGVAVASYPRLFPAEQPELVPVEVRQPSPFTVTADEAQPLEIASPPMPLTTTTNAVTGVRVQHPETWELDVTHRLVSVRSDSCGSAGVIWYPIQLNDPDTAPAQVLERVTAALNTVARTGGGELTLGTIDDTQPATATALLAGSLCGASIRGTANVFASGDRSTIRFSWAPAATYESLAPTLHQVSRNFRILSSGIFLRVHQGKFALAAPSAWTIRQDDEQVTAENGRERIILATLPILAPDSPSATIDTWLQLEREKGRSIDELAPISSQERTAKTADERQWNIADRVVEFTDEDGQRVRGVISAANTPELDEALIQWRQAPAEPSHETDALHLAILDSGRFSFNNASLSLPPAHRPRTTFDISGDQVLTELERTARGHWDHLILGYQRVATPNGELLLAPLANRTDQGEYTRLVDGEVQVLSPAE